MSEFARIVFFVSHYTLPICAIAVIVFSFLALFIRKNGFLTYLLLEDSSRIELTQRESLFGSSTDCDFRLAGLLKEHFVITLKSNSVVIRPLKQGTVLVNDEEIDGEVSLKVNDVILAGNREFSIIRKKSAQKRKEKDVLSTFAKFSLFAFQTLLLLQFIIVYDLKIALCYLLFIALQFVYLLFNKSCNVNLELVVFFLITLGITVVAGMGSKPLLKQLICFAAGSVVAFFIYFVFSAKLAKTLKIPAFLVGVALFIANIVMGVVYNGSQNWVEIGSASFQPSEFVKVIVVFLSAATANTIDKKHNTFGYSVFVLFCVASLAYLRDFGTAAVYIAVYLAVILLRKCDWLYFLAVVGTGVAAITVACVAFPYVAKRFFAFGQAWQHAFDSGFQQTRTMVAVGSGGLLGVGTSKGYLRNVTAFDTDIVFGVICEELGIIVGVCALIAFVLLALYAVKLFNSASCFYSIPACAAVMIFLVQASLNVFGSLDMLPFTGVTLPFISNGGSSAVCCVALIAFFKAAEREAMTRNEKSK